MQKILRSPVVHAAGIVAVAAALATAGMIAPAYGGERSTPPGAVHSRVAALATATRLRTVLLITGQRLAVGGNEASPRSGPLLTPLPGSLSDGLASIRSGGDDLTVPYDALPYVGCVLSGGSKVQETLWRAYSITR